MHLMLDIVDASRYVDGTVKQPSSARDPVGAENWHFNDTYTRVLIGRNIAASEKCHIRGCETAHDMWTNLQKVHQSTSLQIQTEQRRVFRNMRAKEGDDIPNHLTRLKNQCNLIKDFGNVEDSERYNDNVFKRDIASSLPCVATHYFYRQ
jgi:gag-polypeptide of LTR copia-type